MATALDNELGFVADAPEEDLGFVPYEPVRARNLADPSLPRMGDPSMPRAIAPEDEQRAADIQALWYRAKNSSLGQKLLGRNAEADAALLAQAGVSPADKIPNRLEQGGLLPAVIAPFQGAAPRAGQATTTAGKIAAGTYNAAAGLAEGLASPVAGAALLPKVAGRGVSALFAADMLGHVPEQVGAAIDAKKQGDLQGAVEGGVGAAASLGFGGLSAAHAGGAGPGSVLRTVDAVRAGPNVAALRELMRGEMEAPAGEMPGLQPRRVRPEVPEVDLGFVPERPAEAEAPQLAPEAVEPVAEAAAPKVRPVEPPVATESTPTPAVEAPVAEAPTTTPNADVQARAEARKRLAAAMAEATKSAQVAEMPVEAPAVTPPVEPVAAPVENAFIAKSRKLREAKEAAVAEVLAAAGEGETPVEFQHQTRPDKRAVVSREPSDPGQWRITFFDKDGPYSHHVFKSREAAIAAAAGDSWSKLNPEPAFVGIGDYKVSSRERSSVPKPPAEPIFSAPETVSDQRARMEAESAAAKKAAQRAALEQRAAAPMSGKSIDTTGDMLDPSAADNPLFAPRKPEPAPPIDPVIARRNARKAYKVAARELQQARADFKAGRADAAALNAAEFKRESTRRAQAAAESAVPRKAAKVADKPTNVLDMLKSMKGQLNLSAIRKMDPYWSPPPSLRKYFNLKGKGRVDIFGEQMHEAGLTKEPPLTADAVARAIDENYSASVEIGKQASKEKAHNDRLAQDATFEGDIIKGDKGGEKLSAQDLQAGQTFKGPQGDKFVVKEVVPDPDGWGTASVKVDDGKKYGTQIIPGDAAVHVKKGSLKEPDAVVDWLEKQKLDPKKTFGSGIAPDVYNAAIDIAIASWKGGKHIVEAVAEAARWLKERYPNIDVDAVAREMGEGLPGYVHPEKAQAKAQPPVIPPRQTPLPGIDSGAEMVTLNNAKLDASRAERGLPPMAKAARISNPEMWDRAMSELAKEPGLADRLIREQMEKPTVLEAWEELVIAREQAIVQDRYETAAAKAAEFTDAGDPGQADAWDRIANDASNRLLEIDAAYGRGGAGTRIAQALAIRRSLKDEEMTPAALELDWRKAHDYAKPNADERAAFKRQADEYKAALEKEQAATAAAEARERETALKLAEAEARAAAPQIHPEILSKAEGLVRKLETAADAAWKRIRAKMSQAGSIPDPTILSDLAIIGSAKIARGIVEFGRWSKAMVSHVGDWMTEEDLKAVYDASKKRFEEDVKGVPTAVRRAAQKPDVQEKIQDATEKIGVRMAAGEMDSVAALVQKLHRALTEADTKMSMNAKVDRIHDVLKEFDPKITRDDTIDAISGRGKFTLPRQDEVSKIVRDEKQQLRLIGHQHDILAGAKSLPKTGPQRDKMSTAAQIEQQKLNELIRKYNVGNKGGPEQMAGALKTRKRALENRMAIMRQEIAARKRFVETKTPAATDAELEAMQAEYETVKAEHEAIFPKDRTLTPEQQIEIATAHAAKSEELWTKRLEEAQKGNLWTGKKAAKKFSTQEIDAIRARRDAARDAAQELRDIANREPDALAAARRLEAEWARRLEMAKQGKFEDGKKASKPFSTPEIDAIRARAEAAKNEVARLDDLAHPGKTQERRNLEAAIRSNEKAIVDLEGQLKTGNLFPAKAPSRTPSNPQLEALRAKRAFLRDQLERARKIARPGKTADEVQLSQLKARISAETARKLDQMARNDFSPKAKRPPPKLDKEAADAQFALDKIRERHTEQKAKWAFDQLPPLTKFGKKALSYIGVARDIRTGLDLPPVFRQGAVLSLSQPIKAVQSTFTALNAMRSEKVMDRINRDRKKDPVYPLAERAGVFFSEHGGPITKHEEAIRSNLSKKIPLLAGNQRGYMTFLNELRFRTFKSLVNLFFRGRNPTDVELQAVGNMVNVFSGRGAPLLGERAADAMNHVFFAARNATSKFQILFGTPMYSRSPRVIAAAASIYARALIGAGIMYELAKLGGFEVNTNPDSSDFLKLKFGNRRLDPLGGLIQAAVLMHRLATGNKVNTRGRNIDLRSGKYGQEDVPGVLGRFIRSKLAPIPSSTLDLVAGRDFVGNPVTVKSALKNAIFPMTIDDLIQSMKEENVPQARIMELMSLFGAGLQTYDSSKRNAPPSGMR